MPRERDRLTRQALAIPAVRRVVLAFHALTLAEWVLGTAVAISAYDDHGALAVGLVGFRFAPAAVAGLFTALLGDRYGRRRVLSATAAARATCAVTIAGALAIGMPFGFVLAVAWLDVAVGSAYRPAQAGLLPALVATPGQLTAAAVLSSNAKTSGQVLGAVLGGLLLVALPASAVVAIAAGLYALAAVLTARAGRGSRRAHTGSVLGGAAQHLRTMLATIPTLRHDPETRRIVTWSCARSLTRGLWVSLGIVASFTILGMGESGFGLLMAAAGAGTAVSIPLTSVLVGRRLLALPFATGLALCCLPIAGIGVVGHAEPALALALMFAWGAGLTLADVGAQALLNRVVPPSELTRVVGLLESAKLLAEGVGSALAPALVALLGIRGALLGGGLTLFTLLLLDVRGFAAIDRRAVGRVEVLELVRGVPLFAPLRVEGLEAVAAPLTDIEVPAGHEVIRQDAPGTRWYLVAEGELEVLIGGFVVGNLGRGDSFGERGLLRDEPRSATVRATSVASLLTLERSEFLAAVVGDEDAEGPAAGPQGVADVLRRQPLLRAVSDDGCDALIAVATTIALPPDTTLFAQGDEDDRYFVVLEGEIEIRIDGERRRVLAGGDGFGEIAVLHGVPRTASAISRTPARLGAVPGAAVRQCLGLR